MSAEVILDVTKEMRERKVNHGRHTSPTLEAWAERIESALKELDWQPVGNHPSNERILTCIWHPGDPLPSCVLINEFTNHDGIASGHRLGTNKTWWYSRASQQPTHWKRFGVPHA